MDAIEYFKGMRKILCEDHLKIFPKNTIGYQASLLEKSFYDAAIKALEQETILYTKGEVISMLTEIQLEIGEEKISTEHLHYDDLENAESYNTGIDNCTDIIQDSIDKLKAETEQVGNPDRLEKGE